MATPLEREFQPFQVAEFEPMSDYCRNLFRNYREIQVRVLGWLRKASEDRARLANRFRRSKDVKAGDEVVIRDPRHRKAGGKTGYKEPYTDPATVLDCRVHPREGCSTLSASVLPAPQGCRGSADLWRTCAVAVRSVDFARRECPAVFLPRVSALSALTTMGCGVCWLSPCCLPG